MASACGPLPPGTAPFSANGTPRRAKPGASDAGRNTPATSTRRPHRAARAAAWLALATGPASVAQEPPADSAYVGAAACGACHPGQAATQALSGHANSLARPWRHRLAGEFESGPASQDSSGPRARLRVRGGSAVMDTLGEARVAGEPVHWAFGAGEQAVTFVSRVDRDWYLEHRWSFYPASAQLGLTPGHQERPSDGDAPGAGVRYRVFSPQAEIFNCFGCHSTGPLSLGEDYSIVPSEPGVHCEACHGAGSAHVTAAASGEPEEARRRIRHPGRLAGGELNAYCGACHRPPASSPEDIDWTDPWNVRHQPVYLARSQCFLFARDLTCTHCHDPHGPLARDAAAHYNARCMHCHDDSARPPAATCPPTEAAPCSSCHMPSVRPQAELGFTNHWIGVYEERGALRPRR